MTPFQMFAGRFAFGLGLSALLGWVALKWIGPRGFMDLPEGRKCHKGAVPRTGGLAFVVTMLIGLGLGFCALPFTTLQWLGLVVMAGIGLADDRFCLRARHKALVGLGVAVVLAHVGALSLLGQGVDLRLLGQDLPDTFPVYFVLLALFYWCVPQSFNLVDGLDGLAMGYALVVLGALAVAGHLHPFTLGAVAGLLVWNWPRARHFLGDCGSMALGLLLALLVKKDFAHQQPDVILCLFAYPFLDTAMVVVVRLLKGEHPAKADRSHLHHRLQDALPGREGWVMPLLLAQAAACASAVVAKGWGWAVPVAGILALLTEAVWFSVRDLRTSRAKSAKSLGGSPLVVSD